MGKKERLYDYNMFQKLLDEHELSVPGAAKATGIPASVLYDWRKGRCEPKIDKLIKLAKHFDVSWEFFLKEGDSGDESRINETA